MPRAKAKSETEVAEPAAPKPSRTTASTPAVPSRFRDLDELHAALATVTSHADVAAVWRAASKSTLFVVRKHRPADCSICTSA